MGNPIVVLSDTFQRANVAAGSWGTATDGNTWSLLQGVAGDLSVSSNEGSIINGNWDQPILGSTQVADVEILVRYASNMFNGGGPCLRVVNSTNFIHFRTGTAQAGLSGEGFWFRVQVAGTNFDYGAVAFSFTNGAFYWLRARVQDSTLYGKVWADGSIEPGAWSTVAQMSGSGIISSAGKCGMLVNDTGAKVDHFTAYAVSTYRSFIDASSQILQWAEFAGAQTSSRPPFSTIIYSDVGMNPGAVYY